MDRGRVDPLHLHQQADRERVSGVVVRTGAHHVDEFLIFVLLSKFLCSGGQELFCVFHDAVNSLKTGFHGLVELVALYLIQDLGSQFQSKSGAAHRGGSACLVFHNIVAVFRQRALIIKGDGDGSSTNLLCDLRSVNRLRGSTGMRLGDNDRILVQRFGGSVAELVGGVMVNAQFFCFALQEEFCRIQSRIGTAASNEVYVFNNAVASFQDVFDNRFGAAASHFLFLLMINR